MSWSRFDDNWADRIRSLDLDFQTRWHYLSMIQFCSRTGKFDGSMKAVDARSVSDVDDPAGCLNELMAIGLVTRDGDRYILVAIDEHVLPPHLRDDKRKADQLTRQHRFRAHKADDHRLCIPGKCPEVPVTRDITSDTGTGQDGPGLEDVAVGVTAEQLAEPESWGPLPPRQGGLPSTTRHYA